MSDILDFLRRVQRGRRRNLPAWGIVLRVTVLLSAAMLVALALRRSSAALRHLVWTLSLVGALLVPLCSWVLPAWQWAVLPQRQPSPPSIAPVTQDAPPSPGVAPRTEDAPLRSAHSPRPFAERSSASCRRRRISPKRSRQHRLRRSRTIRRHHPRLSRNGLGPYCLASPGPWALSWGSSGWGSALRRRGMLPGGPFPPRTRAGARSCGNSSTRAESVAR